MGLRAAASVVIAGCLAASAAPAMALGTGDSPVRSTDVPSASQSAPKAHYERQSAVGDAAGRADGASLQVLDEDYYYVWTPSHKQERGYWCGPATVQVIDDYWGSYAPQQTYATYMGTTADGTDFSRVDNAIRYYSGQSGYDYYGNLDTGALSGKVHHSLFVHHSPLAADVSIKGSVWGNYVYDHAGHIIPIDGFSWVYNTVRVNDVYNEADYYPSGGQTYGHHTYPFSTLADGISRHWRHAVVCPG